MAHKIDRRKALKILGSGAVVSLAGCTGDDTTEPGDDTSAGTWSDIELTYAGTGGNAYRTFDPAKVTDSIVRKASINFYDPLIFIDGNQDIIPWVAKDWSIEDDGNTWIFELEEGIPFHSGNILTASDVAYSMERALEVGQGSGGQWRGIVAEVEVMDEFTAAINLNNPFAPLGNTLTNFMIVDGETVKQNEVDGEFGERGDYGQEYLASNVAGSGAYMMGNHEPDQELEYTAFEDYWRGWEDNQFQLMRDRNYPEVSSAQQAFMNQDVHILNNNVPPETLRSIENTAHGTVNYETSTTLFYFPMNTQKPPTDDIHVRKAIAHSFDYVTNAEDLFNASASSIASGPVPGSLPGKNEDLEPYELDLDKAKNEIDQASYSVEEINEDLDLTILVYSGAAEELNAAQLLQDGMSEIGLSPEINQTPWAQLAERAGNVEETPTIAGFYHSSSNLMADDFTYLMYHPDAHGTYISQSWYSSPELTNTIEDARFAMDDDERIAKYREAQKLIYDAYPAVFAIYPPYPIPHHNNLQSYFTEGGGLTFRGTATYELRWHDMYWQSD